MRRAAFTDAGHPRAHPAGGRAVADGTADRHGGAHSDAPPANTDAHPDRNPCARGGHPNA